MRNHSLDNTLTRLERLAGSLPSKLWGLTPASLLETIEQGRSVVLVTCGTVSFDRSNLIFELDQHRVWLMNSPDSQQVATWLEQEQVVGVCADELTDVQLMERLDSLQGIQSTQIEDLHHVETVSKKTDRPGAATGTCHGDAGRAGA